MIKQVINIIPTYIIDKMQFSKLEDAIAEQNKTHKFIRTNTEIRSEIKIRAIDFGNGYVNFYTNCRYDQLQKIACKRGIEKIKFKNGLEMKWFDFKVEFEKFCRTN